MKIFSLQYIVALIVAFFCVALFQRCAPRPIFQPTPPFKKYETDEIIGEILKQDRIVKRFVTSGSLVIKEDGADSEVNILIMGEKKPLRIKVEITHSWGRPLFHILIRGEQIKVISFSEKSVYTGSYKSSILSRFFPAPLNRNHIWGLLRGYPTLDEYSNVVSRKGNCVELLNSEDSTVQLIELRSDPPRPFQISFPENGSKISFREYEDSNDIHFARKIRFEGPDEIKLQLRLKQAVFNHAIPPELFEIKIPSNYRAFSVSPSDRN